MKRNLLRSGIMLIVLLMGGMYACQKDQIEIQNDFDLQLRSDIQWPYLWTGGQGGNADCEDVAALVGYDFAFSSGRTNYQDGMFQWPNSLDFEGWPEGLTVTVTDGTFVSFEFESNMYCVGAVIVKGGPNAHIYYFEDGVKSGVNLSAPLNNGQPFGLSNLTFCFVECNDRQECWQGETAFGGDIVGAGRAWWFAYAKNTGVQPIYAGRQMTDATIKIVDGYYTINPGSDLRLAQGVMESVKIQGYSVLPESRPAAGLFEYKSESLTGFVGIYPFYVIHLDVEVKVQCPE
jgi:hypothetical protein